MSKRVFFYREDGIELRFDLDEIVYLKTNANYVDFYSPTTVYMIRTSLEAALSQMPEEDFVQVHRCYAVSVRHIQFISKDSMLLSYGSEKLEIPFTKQYQAGLEKHIVFLGAGSTKKPDHEKVDADGNVESN